MHIQLVSTANTKLVDSTWNKIQKHVLNGDATMKQAGRHLASEWIDANGDKNIVVTAETSLGVVPHYAAVMRDGKVAGKQIVPKTLWMDAHSPGTFKGPYTSADVEATCKAAMQSLLQLEYHGQVMASTKIPNHNVVVPGQHGRENLCVSIWWGKACFPAGPVGATEAVGHDCKPRFPAGWKLPETLDD